MDSVDQVRARINDAAGERHRLAREILGIDWYDTETKARTVIEWIEARGKDHERLLTELVKALGEIAETDAVDAALDPQRAMGIARSTLAKVFRALPPGAAARLMGPAQAVASATNSVLDGSAGDAEAAKAHGKRVGRTAAIRSVLGNERMVEGPYGHAYWINARGEMWAAPMLESGTVGLEDACAVDEFEEPLTEEQVAAIKAKLVEGKTL